MNRSRGVLSIAQVEPLEVAQMLIENLIMLIHSPPFHVAGQNNKSII